MFFLLDVSCLQMKRIACHKHTKYLKAVCGLEDLTARACSLYHLIQTVPDAYVASVPGVKRPEPVAGRVPPSSAEIRQACVFVSSRSYFLLP
jgi:hypothetical protein